ncbi:hypothetical protein [Pseudomonas lurida]|jgi:hypothetical protein|uniref:Uncharacterized protein n=1 Tax=Pseudomonas fluorescens TaxID=294 RepID=A0A5E6MT46_PSEFL|nr:hypothetical protein [Pseudomonas lurida]MBC3925110.1 hypothetical protein [Pseudomonas lurida]VVM14343.1 hypothetical protein PS683_02646 [Pseudomonas fluorescens]VVM87548.1 hypothetical protein PS683_02646 [Pseudomonas fluorescens]
MNQTIRMTSGNAKATLLIQGQRTEFVSHLLQVHSEASRHRLHLTDNSSRLLEIILARNIEKGSYALGETGAHVEVYYSDPTASTVRRFKLNSGNLTISDVDEAHLPVQAQFHGSGFSDVPGDVTQIELTLGELHMTEDTPVIDAHVSYDGYDYRTGYVFYNHLTGSRIQIKSEYIEEKRLLDVYSPSRLIVGETYDFVENPDINIHAYLRFYGPLPNGQEHQFLSSRGTLTVEAGSPGWLIGRFRSVTDAKGDIPEAIITGYFHVKDIEDVTR